MFSILVSLSVSNVNNDKFMPYLFADYNSSVKEPVSVLLNLNSRGFPFLDKLAVSTMQQVTFIVFEYVNQLKLVEFLTSLHSCTGSSDRISGILLG